MAMSEQDIFEVVQALMLGVRTGRIKSDSTNMDAYLETMRHLKVTS